MAHDRAARLFVEGLGAQLEVVGELVDLRVGDGTSEVSTVISFEGSFSGEASGGRTNCRCGRFMTGKCKLGLSLLTSSTSCASICVAQAWLAAKKLSSSAGYSTSRVLVAASRCSTPSASASCALRLAVAHASVHLTRRPWLPSGLSSHAPQRAFCDRWPHSQWTLMSLGQGESAGHAEGKWQAVGLERGGNVRECSER